MITHPILMSTKMVQAILDGHKTMTRRVITQPKEIVIEGPNMPRIISPIQGLPDHLFNDWQPWLKCPFGKPGHALWVRETAYISPKRWGEQIDSTYLDDDGDYRIVSYVADEPSGRNEAAEEFGIKKTPSIHMPRWASRIDLAVLDVKVERVQDITPADAVKEGCYAYTKYAPRKHEREKPVVLESYTPVERFRKLWDETYPKFDWDLNPWVFAIEFKRIDHNDK